MVLQANSLKKEDKMRLYIIFKCLVCGEKYACASNGVKIYCLACPKKADCKIQGDIVQQPCLKCLNKGGDDETDNRV